MKFEDYVDRNRFFSYQKFTDDVCRQLGSLSREIDYLKDKWRLVNETLKQLEKAYRIIKDTQLPE